MGINLQQIAVKLKEARCIVIGDVMLDHYLYGDVSRISPEAPIPVVNIRRRETVPGGAGNVACNLLAMGVQVVLAGIAGEDEDGRLLCEGLEKRGLIWRGIRSGQRPTTVKTRIVGKGQQIVRFDTESPEWLTEEEEERIMDAVLPELEQCDVLIISDYKKGICTGPLLQKVIPRMKERGCPVIVDPKGNDWRKYEGADIVTPNFKEFCEIIGKKIDNTEEAIRGESTAVLDRYHVGSLLVTRSEYGMTFSGNEIVHSFPAKARTVYDVSGAGDTVVAVLSSLIATGMDPLSAADLSNIAAGISVSHSGTYEVSFDELKAEYEEKNDLTDSKIMDLEHLLLQVGKWRKEKKKIIFTNGCFDILHAGHVSYLQKARELGDVLIIGLNADDSVRRLKGNDRPVNPENDRALVLSALAAVDAVVIFNEDTPHDLIRAVAPDVLVKGGDYKTEDIVGREFAGETRVIPFLPGRSTTDVIRRIQNNECN